MPNNNCIVHRLQHLPSSSSSLFLFFFLFFFTQFFFSLTPTMQKKLSNMIQFTTQKCFKIMLSDIINEKKSCLVNYRLHMLVIDLNILYWHHKYHYNCLYIIRLFLKAVLSVLIFLDFFFSQKFSTRYQEFERRQHLTESNTSSCSMC